MVVLPKEISGIVENPIRHFEENPIGILDIIAFACEAEFDFDKAVAEAAADKFELLEGVPVEQIRERFEKIISSKRAGKGLTLLTNVGVLDSILGKQATQNMSKAEVEDFSIYVENIDKTKQTRLRRLALFYKCFTPKKAEAAIKRLEYSPEDEGFLLDGIYLLDKLYFLTNKYDLKKFLVKYGMERYDFLNNLSKAQRIVYDLSVNRIVSRQYVMDNIKEYDEPIFVEDLVIGPEDLRNAGIPDDEFDRIFDAVLDITHIKPYLNTKKDLLEYANKFYKNKWAATFRKLKFIK
ncbi:hypothetical protein [Aminipila sp.]|uniref:hypothetical protein n=1 Tax=Aminipila sp. TaxID=2060095 RepID=UPI0028977D97|nr:hypothetical protein [Aminipila sp.]